MIWRLYGRDEALKIQTILQPYLKGESGEGRQNMLRDANAMQLLFQQLEIWKFDYSMLALHDFNCVYCTMYNYACIFRLDAYFSPWIEENG